MADFEAKPTTKSIRNKILVLENNLIHIQKNVEKEQKDINST